jgi:hypothetical protein
MISLSEGKYQLMSGTFRSQELEIWEMGNPEILSPARLYPAATDKNPELRRDCVLS